MVTTHYLLTYTLDTRDPIGSKNVHRYMYEVYHVFTKCVNLFNAKRQYWEELQPIFGCDILMSMFVLKCRVKERKPYKDKSWLPQSAS